MMRVLGPAFTDAERAAFVTAARSYIGTRWKHQGRDRRGIDCGGLVLASLRDIGKPFEDASKGYGREPYRHSLEAVCALNLGEPVSEPYNLRPGDIALFRVGRAAPNHVGVIGDYVHGGLSLIHAYAINGAVVEAPLDASWLALLQQVYSV